MLSKKGVLKHIYTYTLVWPREKVKWRHTLYQQHIFIYASFFLPPRWKSWKRKMTAYPIIIFIQSLIKFQSVVPEIQMKRAKRNIHTYFHTFIHTDQPSHRIWSGSLTKYTFCHQKNSIIVNIWTSNSLSTNFKKWC